MMLVSKRLYQTKIKIIDGDRGVNYPKQSDFSKTGYCLFLNTGNVTTEGFDLTNCSFISKEKDNKLRKGKLVTYDIVLTTRGTVGNLAYYKKNMPFQNIRINSGMVIIRSDDNEYCNHFLYYIFKSAFMQEQFQLFSSGTAQPQLPIKDLRRISIPIIGLCTQQRIASILSAYDELIEVNNQRIKLLEETARELYKEWFVRMRFPGYKKAKFVKAVPEGFGEEKYFKDFIKLNRGFDLPEEKIREGEFPVIASTSIKAYHNQFKVKAPIITTGRSGSLGKVLYINQDGWPLNTSLYIKDFKGNEPLYIYYTLKSFDFESFNSGAGVPTLNQNHLHKLKLWVAGEELQKKFKDIINPIFQQIATLYQQNTQLRRIRERLLPRLVNGKLAVKV